MALARSGSAALRAAVFVGNCSTVPTTTFRLTLPSGVFSRRLKIQTGLQEHHLVPAGKSGQDRAHWLAHISSHVFNSSPSIRLGREGAARMASARRHSDNHEHLHAGGPQAMREAHGKVVEMLLRVRKAG